MGIYIFWAAFIALVIISLSTAYLAGTATNCKHNLVDSDNEVLTSFPAKKRVHCTKCTYKGYRKL